MNTTRVEYPPDRYRGSFRFMSPNLFKVARSVGLYAYETT